jgi:hypothetical protein
MQQADDKQLAVSEQWRGKHTPTEMISELSPGNRP